MPCYHPISGYQRPDGALVFSELKRKASKRDGYTLRPLEVPCGQCIGCRQRRAREWAMRCMHEASLYDSNCFVTLTYDDDHLPLRGDIRYSDFQRFVKRLREGCKFRVEGKYFRPRVPYFAAAEYGPKRDRPHFHAILFNFDFLDRVKIRQLDSGCDIFRSDKLEKLWPLGYSSVGNVTFESAAYVAKYCMKKQNGPGGHEHYYRVDEFGEYELTPEKGCMSKKPGIGKRWLEKFASDVYPHDYVVVNGFKVSPPRYYDKLYGEDAMEYIKYERGLEAELYSEDNTPRRLADKEQVHAAKLARYPRRDL